MPLSAPAVGSNRRAPAGPAAGSLPLTSEQAAIVDAAHAGGTVVAEALAGTGKTSTLVELARSFGRRPGLYLAFNKSVQLEADRKFSDAVDVRTAHSIAYQAIGRNYGHRLPGNPGASRLSAQQMARILRAKPAMLDSGTINPALLVRIAQATVTSFMKTAHAEISAQHIPARVVQHHSRDGLAESVVPLANRIWADLERTDGKFRFTPDVYLKLWQLRGGRLNEDYVMFDEAQDADPVIASVVARHPGQRIYVGDRNQAIYGWRGAIDAMSQIQDATRLPLTKSFRFGPAIAEEANRWLDLLGSRHQVVGHDPIRSEVRPLGDGEAPRAILCRGNGTALGWVIALLMRGVKVALAPGDRNAGKDIERFAWAAKKLMDGEPSDHPDLVGFGSWSELTKFVEEEEDTDDLKRLVGIVNRVGVNEVINAIRGLSLEHEAQVTVSTAHKAKGLEWSSVKVADDFTPPEDDDERDPADLMLAYVTVTRAKNLLDRGRLEPELWS